MKLNCGECLDKHVTVIRLWQDGTCPCCLSGHDLVTWTTSNGEKRHGVRKFAKAGSDTYVLWINPSGAVNGGGWVDPAQLTEGHT
jgi:hypothetical protein